MEKKLGSTLRGEFAFDCNSSISCNYRNAAGSRSLGVKGGLAESASTWEKAVEIYTLAFDQGLVKVRLTPGGDFDFRDVLAIEANGVNQANEWAADDDLMAMIEAMSI